MPGGGGLAVAAGMAQALGEEGAGGVGQHAEEFPVLLEARLWYNGLACQCHEILTLSRTLSKRERFGGFWPVWRASSGSFVFLVVLADTLLSDRAISPILFLVKVSTMEHLTQSVSYRLLIQLPFHTYCSLLDGKHSGSLFR